MMILFFCLLIPQQAPQEPVRLAHEQQQQQQQQQQHYQQQQQQPQVGRASPTHHLQAQVRTVRTSSHQVCGSGPLAGPDPDADNPTSMYVGTVKSGNDVIGY
jgi:hypothetical protein